MNLKLSDELCRVLITNNGVCKGLSCEHCPGSEKYNNGSFCNSNGWRDKLAKYIMDEDPKTVQSAKNWIRKNTGEVITDFIKGKTYIYIDKEYRNGWDGPGCLMSKVLDNLPVKCTKHTQKKYAAFDRTRETREWDWNQGFENWRLVNIYKDNIFDEGEL